MQRALLPAFAFVSPMSSTTALVAPQRNTCNTLLSLYHECHGLCNLVLYLGVSRSPLSMPCTQATVRAAE